MKTLTPEAALMMLTTTAAGAWMMLAGANKRLLEWRRRQRMCAGCGRRLERPVCPTCSS